MFIHPHNIKPPHICATIILFNRHLIYVVLDINAIHYSRTVSASKYHTQTTSRRNNELIMSIHCRDGIRLKTILSYIM